MATDDPNSIPPEWLAEFESLCGEECGKSVVPVPAGDITHNSSSNCPTTVGLSVHVHAQSHVGIHMHNGPQTYTKSRVIVRGCAWVAAMMAIHNLSCTGPKTAPPPVAAPGDTSPTLDNADAPAAQTAVRVAGDRGTSTTGSATVADAYDAATASRVRRVYTGEYREYFIGRGEPVSACIGNYCLPTDDWGSCESAAEGMQVELTVEVSTMSNGVKRVKCVSLKVLPP